ncbi:MAG TPA: (2Fe-2S)-binding protein [Defluviitoga sp.]|nr:(2Fe-2S)-binding protein [Defluviitoga sp.]HOP24531.1 (2Fe-2S)-binding protein [Defluviitoga sp.]HPZ29060.1 (2Fe-2S)-binding protein [Defluviitoga sp.]HQD62927.1 (2Fe-2S)-binding protein [Defluviitoga sp.]
MDENKVIICRCEDVTLAEIRNLIKQGFTTVEEIKRLVRSGMGPCQGKTCGLLIAREIAEITNTSIEKIEIQNMRPPYGGVTFEEVIAGDTIEE